MRGRAGKIIKRIIIFLIIASLLGAGGYYGFTYMKRSNQKEIIVVDVASIVQDDTYYYYGDNGALSGEIVTNVVQNVRIDKDVIIENLLVSQGDEVRKGDRLMTLDMTLVDMELNITKLKKQKLEQDLNTAVKRLDSLQRGGPVTEEESDSGTMSLTEETALLPSNDGFYTAAAFPVLLAAEMMEGGLEEELTGEDISSNPYGTPNQSYVDPGYPAPAPSTEDYGEEGAGEDTGEDGGGDEELGSGEEYTPSEEEEDPFEPIQGPTPTPFPVDPAMIDGLIDGLPPFYMVLDYDSEPFTGTGTPDDPLVFLCSNARGVVTVKGSFFNKMAGYNDDGSVQFKPGGYWYVLEFHTMDTITDFSDRTASSIGYYYIDGSMLERPVNPFAEAEFTVSGADQYERYEPEEPEIPDDSGYTAPESSISRAEAIKLQESKIRALQLSLKESDVRITKLERKLSMQEIDSLIDGVVSYAGNPVEGTSSMESFLRINSAEGYYIKGTVNEMSLDQLSVGTRLKCMTDMGEEFEAEVISIASYPSKSNGYFWNANPNSSNYGFSANICPEYDYVQINQDTMLMSVEFKDGKEEEEEGITIPKAFVRSENGVSFVYKDKKGVLKKQAVKISKADSYGYTITISEGISLSDRLAFPYDSDAAEGVKTKKGTLDELYEYS